MNIYIDYMCQPFSTYIPKYLQSYTMTRCWSKIPEPKEALVFLDLLMKVSKASSGGALFLAVVPVAVLENWERESWIQLHGG
jgi:hypothetical protein